MDELTGDTSKLVQKEKKAVRKRKPGSDNPLYASNS